MPARRPARMVRRVAGVYTPAFVERWMPARPYRLPAAVSPEFILRPSLSAVIESLLPPPSPRLVSPEFILRPSLSVNQQSVDQFPPGGVSPEFILRPSLSARGPILGRITTW